MRGIRVEKFGEPSVMTYGELSSAELRPDLVRVRVCAVGVNPADAYIRQGKYAFFTPALPYTPGFDCAGVVDEVGPEVKSVSVGDRVFVAALGATFCSGAYAEEVVTTGASVHRLNADLSFAQGAAVGVPCTTAWRALFQRARVVAGDVVLIHGASGGVGLHATQLAASAGAVVIGTASSPEGAALVRQGGADHVVDHSSATYVDEIRAIAGGRGVDVIIEMLANVNLENDLDLLATRGRVVVVGSRGAISITPRATMIKEAMILGTALWNATPEESRDALHGVTKSLEAGVLRPVVGIELPLRDAVRSHQLILGTHARGKMILLPFD